MATEVELGVMAEDQGFDSVFVVETVTNDAMATVEAIALATRRITIGTGIANILLRRPALLGAGALASLSDRLLDEVCLVGPASRYQEQLAAFSAAGVQYPILAAQAVNEDYANAVRRILKAFGGR
jgi:alkanesulfonate monooxygenase SsuD/methylene tetrahydromethanopterin reductase-like flavin-dependent oxidoreductase (luciferase family)